MSRKGNCWNNAVAESFFKTLKSELINYKICYTLDQAKLDMFKFIAVWYHIKRTHIYNGFTIPEELSKLKYLKSADLIVHFFVPNSTS
tara:strand:- start:221 stop:484 length:264 start_codon:yes stop_codon:yes gene_type:complete